MMFENETSDEFLKRMFGNQVDNPFLDIDQNWMSNTGSEFNTTSAIDEGLDVSNIPNQVNQVNFAELSSTEFSRTPGHHDSTSLAIEVGVLKQRIEDLQQNDKEKTAKLEKLQAYCDKILSWTLDVERTIKQLAREVVELKGRGDEVIEGFLEN